MRLAELVLIDSLALSYLRLDSAVIFPKIINFVIGPANFKLNNLSSTLAFWPQLRPQKKPKNATFQATQEDRHYFSILQYHLEGVHTGFAA